MKSSKAKYIFLLPAVIYLFSLTIYPFLYNLIYSLTNLDLTSPGQIDFVGFSNYIRLLTSSLFQVAVRNTIIMAVTSIFFESVIGITVAKIFHRLSAQNLKGVKLVRTIYILPMMVTPLVTGLLWSYIFNPTLGVANYFLSLLGIEPIGWLASGSTALPSLIMVNVWQWTPFLMLFALAGLMNVPKQQYEAAIIDGASWYQKIIYIELPQIKNILLIGIVLRLMENLRLFELVYATTRGGPGDATEVISMFAYRQGFQFFNAGFAAAVSIFILILGIVVANLAIKFMAREGRV